MDFLEKIGDTITTKGKEAADKAKELAEVANLKSQIATCEEVIKKNYMEIGKIYFEHYGDMPEAPFEKQCSSINNAKRGVEDLQEKIKEIKGIQYKRRRQDRKNSINARRTKYKGIWKTDPQTSDFGQILGVGLLFALSEFFLLIRIWRIMEMKNYSAAAAAASAAACAAAARWSSSQLCPLRIAS